MKFHGAARKYAGWVSIEPRDTVLVAFASEEPLETYWEAFESGIRYATEKAASDAGLRAVGDRHDVYAVYLECGDDGWLPRVLDVRGMLAAALARADEFPLFAAVQITRGKGSGKATTYDVSATGDVIEPLEWARDNEDAVSSGDGPDHDNAA